MKKFLVSAFSLSVVVSFSQYRQGYEDSMSGALYFFNDTAEKGAEHTYIKGSPYVDGIFKKAEIVGYENVKLPFLRYNAYKDEMEFERAGDLYYVPKVNGMTVKFVGETYKYINYLEDDVLNVGFLVEVSKGNSYSLYKKESVKYVESKDAFTSYVSSRPAEFIRNKSVFYLKYKDSPIQKLPSKKKELIKMFPDQESEISDYLKKNKVSFSKEADLIDLTKFLNTL